MEIENNLSKSLNNIINKINSQPDLTNDEKAMFLYRECGKLLLKSSSFFLEKNEAKQNYMYDNPNIIENNEVICRSVVDLYCKLAKKISLEFYPRQVLGDGFVKFPHWTIIYKNEGKKYLINPIPDFYRVQMGFSTEHFCSISGDNEYYKQTYDVMDKEYLRIIDEKLGYLKSGLYTDELFDRLNSEIHFKISNHIKKTSKFYQEYYLKLLDLIKNQNVTIEEKMLEIKKIDPNYSKNEKLIRETFEKEIISLKMKNAIKNGTYNYLNGIKCNFGITRLGANFVGEMDITTLNESKMEIILYKFQYMLNCLLKYNQNLTGYLENLNFIKYLMNGLFPNKKGEKRLVQHHSLYKENVDGTKDYYFMFSVNTKKDAVDGRRYYFYDYKNNIIDSEIEPLSFMRKRGMDFVPEMPSNQDLSILSTGCVKSK